MVWWVQFVLFCINDDSTFGFVVDGHFEWIDFFMFKFIFFLLLTIFLFAKFLDVCPLDFFKDFSFGFFMGWTPGTLFWSMFEIFPKTRKNLVVKLMFFQKIMELFLLAILLLFLFQILFVGIDWSVIDVNVSHITSDYFTEVGNNFWREVKSFLYCLKFWFDFIKEK